MSDSIVALFLGVLAKLGALGSLGAVMEGGIHLGLVGPGCPQVADATPECDLILIFFCLVVLGIEPSASKVRDKSFTS